MAARALVRRVAAHPAVRFIVLGGLLFGAHQLREGSDGKPVRLEGAPREALAEDFAERVGRAPNEGELQAAVERWAQDEALLQHAYALGLHRADAVVRRRLIQDVEFLLEADAEPVDDQEVRAYFERESERFVVPERRSFDHVFVAGTQPNARERGEALRARLLDGAAPGTLGDPTSAGARLTAITRKRLATRLGDRVAEAAFALTEGAWSAPLPSSLGFHLLRLTETLPSRPQSFEEVAPRLRKELTQRARERALEEGRRALRERYTGGAP